MLNFLIYLFERLKSGKNEKVDSSRGPAVKFIGKKQLVYKVTIILKPLRFWGQFFENLIFCQQLLN